MAKHQCIVCDETLRSEEKNENVLKCGCTMVVRCRKCINRTIWNKIDCHINKGTMKTEELSAKCDICQREVSSEFLKQLMREAENEDFGIKPRATLPTTRSMSSSEVTRQTPIELPKKALAWMSEDKKWVEVWVTEYETAEKRTLKELRVGGPVRKRGQFKYWFYEKSREKRKRKIEDYFSEDDDFEKPRMH
jgi:hypothetical protein